MRTTKFRGKRLDNGEWAIGLLIKMWGAWHILDWDDENTAYPVDPNTIGQYTGLKDKNGQEIYEGDIFKAGYFGGADVVTWDDENARYIGRSPKGCISYVGREPAVEIIGNIHDNPELLKGGEQ